MLTCGDAGGLETGSVDAFVFVFAVALCWDKLFDTVPCCLGLDGMPLLDAGLAVRPAAQSTWDREKD